MSKRGKSLKGGKSGEVCPPEQKRVRDIAPRNLSDIKAIRAEMARVYRMIFEGNIFPEDATKLVFILNNMVQAIRHEAEMSQLMNAYQDAWSGVNITAPEGGPALLAPAPHVEIIPPVKSEEKDHDER